MSLGGGAESSVEIECPRLAQEEAAQIEARVRASLFTSDVAATRIDILCSAATTNVRVQSDRGESVRELTTLDGWSDNVLAAVTDALRELAARPTSAAPTPSASAPLTPVTSASAKVRAKPKAKTRRFAAAAVAPSASADERDDKNANDPANEPSADDIDGNERDPLRTGKLTASAFRVGLGAIGETWATGLAFGGSLAVERRVQSFHYGVSLALVSDLKQRGTFSALEGAAGVDIGYRVPRIALDLVAGAGISVLSVSPEPGITPSSRQTAALPYAEARFMLPLRLRNFEIAPGAGLRLFTASRDVNVDGDRRLGVGTSVARFTLDFGYELSAHPKEPEQTSSR